MPQYPPTAPDTIHKLDEQNNKLNEATGGLKRDLMADFNKAEGSTAPNHGSKV